MKTIQSNLLDYEFDALISAVRRDLRSAMEKSMSDPGNAAYHGINARMNIRLLEALAPRVAAEQREEWRDQRVRSGAAAGLPA